MNTDDLKSKANAAQAAAAKLGDVKEKAGGIFENLKDKAADLLDAAADKAGDWADKLKS